MSDNLEIVATLPPMHPGELLREEFLVPLDLSAGRLAKACGVLRTRIERIVAEKIGMTGDTAIRLGRVFDTTPQFRMNAQAHYDLETARVALGTGVERIVPLQRAA